jgi:ATP-binding cassette, subfamily B, bacterial
MLKSTSTLAPDQKAGSPGGGMPPASGGAGPVTGAAPKIAWGKLWLWGWQLLGVSRSLAVLYLAVSLASTLVTNAATQFVGEVTTHLQRIAQPEEAQNLQAKTEGENSRASRPAAGRESVKQQKAEQRADVVTGYTLWIVFALLGLVLGIPAKWIATKMDVRMSNHLRGQVFDRVLSQSPEFFFEYSGGDLATIINTFAIQTQMTLRQILVDPVLQLLILFATTGQMIYNFSRLSGSIDFLGAKIPSAAFLLLVVLLALAAPSLIGRLGKRLSGAGRELQQTIAALSSLVTGAVLSPEEIQAMRSEKLFSAKYRTLLGQSLTASLRQQAAVGLINILNQLPTLLVQIILLGLGLWLAIQSSGAAPVGNVLTILLLTPLLMAPINALSASMVMLFQGLPSIERVESVLKRTTRAEERPGTFAPQTLEPTLEARDLVFAYQADAAPVFSGLRFRAPAGQRTGFVAKMGQGKTTFFKLALRFHDPQSGQILLGGHPSTDFTFDSIRQHVVMMSQFPVFFYGSLRENLGMPKPEATDDELTALCQRTGIWEILSSKRPQITLDTELAAARTLSGGQKKLLALTRCLLRDPSFLFLDEPTVGMDNEEKFQLIDKLRTATEGKTVMVVDHDVNWLLQFCDYFVVMDKGKVVEQGTMGELLHKRGLLYHLYLATQGPRAAEIATYIAQNGQCSAH